MILHTAALHGLCGWHYGAQRCWWSYLLLCSGGCQGRELPFQLLPHHELYAQGSILFRWMWKKLTRPESSMYLLQNCGGVWKVDSASCSTSSMTRFGTTTDTDDPIAILWICLYTLPTKPGRWPPGKVGERSRCHQQRGWSCLEEMGHSSASHACHTCHAHHTSTSCLLCSIEN